MKNAVFRDVTPCSSCKNRRPSETPVFTAATLRNIQEDGILNYELLSYKILCPLYSLIADIKLNSKFIFIFLGVSMRAKC
jgi:hypothetical protein